MYGGWLSLLWVTLVWSASMISSGNSGNSLRSYFRICRVEGEVSSNRGESTRVRSSSSSSRTSEDGRHLVAGLKGLHLENKSPYGQVQPKLTKLIIRHSSRRSTVPENETDDNLESPPNSDPSRNDSSSSQDPSPRSPRTPRIGDEMDMIGGSNGHSRVSLLLKDRGNCHLLVEGGGVVLISREVAIGTRSTYYHNVRIPSKDGSHTPRSSDGVCSSPRAIATSLEALDAASDDAILSSLVNNNRMSLKLILDTGSLVQIYLPSQPFDQQSPSQRRSFLHSMIMAREQASMPLNILEQHPGYLIEALLVLPPGSASGSAQSSPSNARRLKHRPLARSKPNSNTTTEVVESSDAVTASNSCPMVQSRADGIEETSLSSTSARTSPHGSPVVPRVQFKRNPKFKLPPPIVDTPRPDDVKGEGKSDESGLSSDPSLNDDV